MKKLDVNKIKLSLSLFLSLWLSACATTNIEKSWSSNTHDNYEKPLIVVVSDSQQTRQIFEKYLSEQLKQTKINAVPSYLLIDGQVTISQESVSQAVMERNLDSVILLYLRPKKSTLLQTDTILQRENISKEFDNYYFSSTLITNPGRYNRDEIFYVKVDLLDKAVSHLIWTMETRTAAPKSIDNVIIDISHLIVEQLTQDKLIK